MGMQINIFYRFLNQERAPSAFPTRMLADGAAEVRFLDTSYVFQNETSLIKRVHVSLYPALNVSCNVFGWRVALEKTCFFMRFGRRLLLYFGSVSGASWIRFEARVWSPHPPHWFFYFDFIFCRGWCVKVLFSY